MTQSTIKIQEFKKIIWDYYAQHKRYFVWRNVDNPYYIFVSEIMLQQTQTYRVEPKFERFIRLFPTVQALAHASLKEVLAAWQGLGYNRRARYVYESAKIIVEKYQGMVPSDPDVLVTLPGIGPNTAGSISCFAFNKPTIFIETNIRSVFIQHFFADKDQVCDKDLLALIHTTIDPHNAREWYYALMDYGVFLKKYMINPSRKSAHYTKQSSFEGSDRQIRGMIIRILLAHHSYVLIEDIVSHINKNEARVMSIVEQLVKEKLINSQGNTYKIL